MRRMLFTSWVSLVTSPDSSQMTWLDAGKVGTRSQTRPKNVLFGAGKTGLPSTARRVEKPLLGMTWRDWFPPCLWLVSSANVLLLDEPTNNLDPASRAEVLAAIRTYQGAIVLVTHDEGAVQALEPDRVLVLPDGVEDLWSPDYAELIALA